MHHLRFRPVPVWQAACAAAAAAALLLLAATGPLVGQTRFEVGLAGGLSTFLGKEPTGAVFGSPDRFGAALRGAEAEPRLATSYAVGAALRVRGGRLGFETSAVWTPTDICLEECGSGQADLYIAAYTANGILYFPIRSSPIEPFMILGGGARVYDSDETVAYPAWTAGGGFALPIVSGVDLRVEGRNYMSVTDVADFHRQSSPNPSDKRLQSDLIVTVGFTFYRATSGDETGRSP